MNIVIRVDGNIIDGLGHIYRGVALAEILKKHFSVKFLTKQNSITSPISDAGFDFDYIPSEIELLEEPIFFNKTYLKETIIVLDGYEFIEDYQQKIKDFDFTLVYIDDLAQGIQKADLVINHSPGAKECDYKKESYTKLALGSNFSLIRKSFIDFNRENVNQKKIIKIIFVSFGGADPMDFSFKAVQEILNIDFIKVVNVVLGAAYIHNDIYKLQSDKIRLHRNLSEEHIFDLMKNSDIAIVPASTISIELAVLGIPMLLGYFVSNQQGIYNGFIENNIAVPLGNFNIFKFEQLENNIEYYLSNLNYFNLISISNPSENIINLFHFNKLDIRKVQKKDMEFVFNLSNEPLVRENSFNSNLINFEDHKKWFENQLKNNSLFFILENENKEAIGQIRFNKEGDHSVIGVSISNKFRRKGYALEGLNIAQEEYFKYNRLPIYAYVKKSNLVSVKLFKKGGFNYFKDVKINNIDSLILIKEQ